MNIRELMDGIRKREFVLPEFQREYVWSREQAKQLFVSLFKQYPTGSLLFWKTDNPPDIKNAAVRKDKLGTTQVILDGQQRLTTLYLLTQGEIPPYYTEKDILNDPRDLYFNVDSGDFQFYQASRMEKDSRWVPVTECFRPTGINIFQRAKENAPNDAEVVTIAERFNENLTRLKNIMEKTYPVQTVPSSAQIEDAIDVFDRVNSLGTKLTDADLALTHMTGKWPQARQVMKDQIHKLEDSRFYFDLAFLVRCLVGVVTKQGLFPIIHREPSSALKAGWTKVQSILGYLVHVLPGHGHIHSTEDLNSTNVLVPVAVHLARRGNKFQSEADLRQCIHWIYAAHAWSRYTSQTDTRIDHDIAIVHRRKNPWPDLIDVIIDQRGRIEVKASDLEGRWVQHPLYRLAFVIAKSRGAVDWFNGVPLDKPQDRIYAVHSHHIFPISMLYGEGRYDKDNHVHKKIINEIANRAFLTSASNIGLGSKPPADYLPKIEAKFPGALAKQFIPNDPSLWEVRRFEEFLEARRHLIARAINERMAELLGERVRKSLSLAELSEAGESAVLEYKASLRWDYREYQVSKEVERAVAKTVAGFLNSEGGTLVIGISDDGQVLGLEPDLRSLGKRNLDAFEQKFRQVLNELLGAEYSGFVATEFPEHDGKECCVVTVEPSPKAVYVENKQNQTKEFYIRSGNTTRPLDTQAAHEYVQMHWE